MGIIIRQSFKGTVWSYLGVLIGFVTATYLYTEYLTTEVIGLFGLLASYAALTGQLFLLGFQGVTSRLFPYFRDKENNHNGFLFLSSIVFIIGFSIFLLAYYSFKPVLVESNLEKSALFANYIYLLIPLTFFSMAFTFLDNYNRLLYDAVTGAFLQEFLQRMLTFLLILVYVFAGISINQLIIAFAAIVCLKGLLILLFLLKQGEISLKPKLGFIDSSLKKEITSVALYSILASLGAIYIFNVDKIFINQMLDLSDTGVYTIAFYFGTLVVIPSRVLLKISGTIISEAWKKNDLDEIKNVYYKSCLNQFIIGGFLFLGIWANIDNILIILGEDYYKSKWVIFFVGIGYLIDMMTGANGLIINYSKYYKTSLYFIVSLMVISTIFFYVFIPVWGITGAAIAVAATLFINNLIRYLFLYFKFRLQPFDYKFLLITTIYIALYLLVSVIPQLDLVLDILVRGTLISVVILLIFLKIPLSEEISKLLQRPFVKHNNK